MQALNFDGIKISKNQYKTMSPKRLLKERAFKQADIGIIAVKKKQIFAPKVQSVEIKEKKYRILKVSGVNYSLALGFGVAVLVFTFGAGFWSALQTPKSQAEAKLPESKSIVYKPPIPLAVLPQGSVEPPEINSQVLFSMPLDQLEGAFAERHKFLTEKTREETLENRAQKIENYLTQKKASFAKYARTIAQQPHWKLILAISFAESSWGKNCADNNCSNIGVKPGHELWHEYEDYGEWIEDFNKLLERRYKDWTLNEMCGVYVKPCNQNWLLATKSVLNELKNQNVE